MEYVQVKFPEDRPVFVDGYYCGFTNSILFVNPGTHRFHLGEPQNYQPQEILRAIENTNELEPLTIAFDRA